MTVLTLITPLKPMYKKIHHGCTARLRTTIAVPVDITHNYQSARSAARYFITAFFVARHCMPTSCAVGTLDTQSPLFYSLPITKQVPINNLLINYKEVGRKKVDKKLFAISNLQKTYWAGLSGLMLKCFSQLEAHKLRCDFSLS